MRILQINTVAKSGSIARIMSGITECGLENGHEMYIAFGRGDAEGKAIYYKCANDINVVGHVLRNFFLGESGFGSAKDTKTFIQWIEQIKPDVIHLHNIHGFYINVELLFDYIKKKQIPVVWTFHDCWPFTGHCAYYDSVGCDKWKSHCQTCDIHRSAYPYALFKDNSYAAYERKRGAFTGVSNLTIITPSHWLEKEVKESFLKGYTVHVIPNGIDTDTFVPLKDKAVRHKYGIAEDRKVILGVANRWEPRKGLSYFLRLAEDLQDNYLIVLVGMAKRQATQLNRKYSDRILALPRTNNVQELVELYNCADVFVNPTLEDNFPTTNLEAMACGIPVITFNTGGSAECITQESGISVEKGNYQELLNVLLDFSAYKFTRETCAKQAQTYNKNKQYCKYFEIYENSAKRNEII